MTPGWNPAVENQATDRAYRIGQAKPVFVYKLMVEDGIEEAIEILQARQGSARRGAVRGRRQIHPRPKRGRRLGSFAPLDRRQSRPAA